MLLQQSGVERLFQQSGEGRVFQPSGEGRVFQQSGEEMLRQQSGVERLFQQSGEGRVFQPSGEGRLVQQSGVERLFQQSGVVKFLQELMLWIENTQPSISYGRKDKAQKFAVTLKDLQYLNTHKLVKPGYMVHTVYSISIPGTLYSTSIPKERVCWHSKSDSSIEVMN